MKRYLPLLLLLFFLTAAMKKDKPAYQIFDLRGKPAAYEDLLKKALDNDIIFFGELHNSPICHWLELELTRDLQSESKSTLLLGAEMFESDNQLLLDEYLAGKIKEKNFEDEVKLWDNYKTDYKPLLNYAKENGLPFIATNIPRRYATLVNKSGFEGLDSLSDAAKELMPPLPIQYDPELKGYKDMSDMMGGEESHATPNIAKAQALKDATMAYFILKNRNDGTVFLHFNGTYHSQNFEGIVWYIRQVAPELRIMTIASVEQDSVDELEEENIGLADFTLCIPSSMGKTY